jgi:twitching motility protein PilT
MHHADTTALDPWIRYLLDCRATDLHFSAGSGPRVRIDGRLVAVPQAELVTAQSVDSMLHGLLGSEGLERFREERQADFAFSWSGEGAGHERFRANAFVQIGGPALALRHIPGVIPEPDDIGLPVSVQHLLKRPHGLVLVTGPTGSGKSTSLAAMLQWINATRAVHILTIEDPVEYMYVSDQSLVNQREVGEDVPSFEDGLRAALREDPDVVLVGEMRDLETISLTLTLAETGHLVFATVHTNDAAQTVDRIIDAFPPDQQEQVRAQLSMTLAAVISQRLVPRVGGGRVAAYEVLMGSPAVSNMIREGKVRQLRNVIATGRGDGMTLLEHSLATLVAEGVVTLDEARAHSVHPDEIGGPGVVAAPGSVPA